MIEAGTQYQKENWHKEGVRTLTEAPGTHAYYTEPSKKYSKPRELRT